LIDGVATKFRAVLSRGIKRNKDMWLCGAPSLGHKKERPDRESP